MKEQRLFESVPNFSEGRDRATIDAIAGAASRSAHLLDVSADADHNRAVVSVAGYAPGLSDGLVAGVAEAAERIDLRAHQGVHPRVGAADVVPIIPLGAGSLGEAHAVARELGERIWSELHIPVYFYGHGEPHTLADIRAGRAAIDIGGPSPHAGAGAVCVGARAALVAFNVVLSGEDLPSARELARSLRESGGGLRGVQALAFALSNGQVQLSMNLFRVDETRPEDVIAELERRGVAISGQEVVGLCPASAANQAAYGRLLEGRLASAAARVGAQRCTERGGEEHVLLGARLDREARELADLDGDQEAILGGAERAAALIQVMRAAQVSDLELEAMLVTAARGLRAALTADTVAAYGARMAALGARLG